MYRLSVISLSVFSRSLAKYQPKIIKTECQQKKLRLAINRPKILLSWPTVKINIKLSGLNASMCISIDATQKY